ncbi:MAG: hypothetical protein RLZZ338_99 [Cyanobacteriota bacterium]|jgi:hypothetical protein
MRGYITPDRIANNIRMLRSDSRFKGSILIAEGDTDARLWKNFIDATECYVENAYNKEKAVEVLKILERDNFPGVLAIVDGDFSVLEGNEPRSPNLFFTDTHDIETMMLKSPALEKILREHGSEAKINNFGKDVRATLLESGKPIGYLRFYSLKHDLSFRFENLSFPKFINKENLEIDMTKLIKTVLENSQKHDNPEEIKKNLNNLISEMHDPWYVCCGHDLIEILSLGLRKPFGSCNSKDVEPTTLEKDLRLAYEGSYFVLTQLYRDIREWERVNQPFKVFAIMLVIT